MSGLSSYAVEVPAILQNDSAWLVAWGVLAAGTFIGLVYNNHQMRKLSNTATI